MARSRLAFVALARSWERGGNDWVAYWGLTKATVGSVYMLMPFRENFFSDAAVGDIFSLRLYLSELCLH